MVNWKLLSLLNEDRQKEDSDLPQLLNVGSCGLHVVHGAFCTGCQSTDWRIDGFLRALWYLFPDSQARRGDFTAVTGCTVFPLKLCATRWVEDEKVVQRAIEIWPNIEQYIAHVLKETKRKHQQVHHSQLYRRQQKIHCLWQSCQFLYTLVRF